MDHSKHIRLSDTELTPDILDGATIYGPGEEEIGSVSHVHGSGPTSQVVVDVGGFLGIGAKPVAIPLSQLEFMRDEDGDVHAVTTWTKDQLKDRLSISTRDPDTGGASQGPVSLRRGRAFLFGTRSWHRRYQTTPACWRRVVCSFPPAGHPHALPNQDASRGSSGGIGSCGSGVSVAAVRFARRRSEARFPERRPGLFLWNRSLRFPV